MPDLVGSLRRVHWHSDTEWFYPALDHHVARLRVICEDCGLTQDVEVMITDRKKIKMRIIQNERATESLRLDNRFKRLIRNIIT